MKLAEYLVTRYLIVITTRVVVQWIILLTFLVLRFHVCVRAKNEKPILARIFRVLSSSIHKLQSNSLPDFGSRNFPPVQWPFLLFKFRIRTTPSSGLPFKSPGQRSQVRVRAAGNNSNTLPNN